MGFSEQGGSGFDLAGRSHQTTSTDPSAGFMLSEAFTTATATILPSFGLRYERTLGSNGRSVPVSTLSGVGFEATGNAPGKNRLETEIGVAVTAGKSLTFFADYGAALPIGSLMANDVEAGLRVMF